MKLYIKHMVCRRCIMAVKSELIALGLHPITVELGEIEIEETAIGSLKDQLMANLLLLGFELIDDKKSKIIEKVKTLIVDLVHNKANEIKVNLSDYLSEHIPQDYNSVSNLFSEIEGITIEKYYIYLRIEKVKELIIYDELSLSEIAFQLHYSSIAHLSNQFKRVTGFSPTYFKSLKHKKRRQIEDL